MESLKEGMILGKTIYGSKGEVLLTEGAVIKKAYINKIKELNYNGLYIVDEESDGIEINDVVDLSTRNEVVNTLKGAFDRVKKGLNDSLNTQKEINKLVENIVDQILRNDEILVNIMDLKRYDDYTYFHSTNVAVLSVIIGTELGLSEKELYELCLAGLLHDIGKMYVPEEILNKNGSLSDIEWEEIKKHPEFGYRITKDKFNIPTKAYVGIYQHHEKYDGSGYPKGLKGEEISLYGRILCIADIYDALVSDRPYRKGLSPSEAMEYIMAGGGYYYDSDLVQIFYKKVAPYPVGTVVELSDKRVAIVVSNKSNYCMRPTVKIIRDHLGNKVEPYDVDLSHMDQSIVSVTITGIHKVA